jgi:hypothetical protein
MEILIVYYLSAYHVDYFLHSRSIDMILPSPSIDLLAKESLPFVVDPIVFVSFRFCEYLLRFSSCSRQFNDQRILFEKFLDALDNNGEIKFTCRQIDTILEHDAYRFTTKKLQHRTKDFTNFLHNHLVYREKNRCRSLKSLCRQSIKMNIEHYPNDIEQLTCISSLNIQLRTYLVYENRFVIDV